MTEIKVFISWSNRIIMKEHIFETRAKCQKKIKKIKSNLLFIILFTSNRIKIKLLFYLVKKSKI